MPKFNRTRTIARTANAHRKQMVSEIREDFSKNKTKPKHK